MVIEFNIGLPFIRLVSTSHTTCCDFPCFVMNFIVEITVCMVLQRSDIYIKLDPISHGYKNNPGMAFICFLLYLKFSYYFASSWLYKLVKLHIEIRFFTQLHGNSKLSMTSCPPSSAFGMQVRTYDGSLNIRAEPVIESVIGSDSFLALSGQNRNQWNKDKQIWYGHQKWNLNMNLNNTISCFEWICVLNNYIITSDNNIVFAWLSVVTYHWLCVLTTRTFNVRKILKWGVRRFVFKMKKKTWYISRTLATF